MARKKSKKRVRRKSARKSSRRKNPNFVKTTASAAAKYKRYWEKKGVKRPQDITLEMVKDKKNLQLAKIKFKQAAKTLQMFDKAMARYESRLVEYKAKLKEWNETKKAGTDLPKPARPSKPDPRSHAKDPKRAGDYFTNSEKSATRYLKQAFRWNKKVVEKSLTNKNSMAAMADASPSKWLKAKARTGQIQVGLLGARLAEAITVVGPAKAAKLFREAQKNAAAYEKKKLEAKARRDKANKTRWQNQLKKLEAKQATVKKKLSSLGAVASRARSRMKKARKARRRNPSVRRRRNSCATTTRKKGAVMRRKKSRKRNKKSMKKAKKARKSRKAKKARKSRKSRRSRRR